MFYIQIRYHRQENENHAFYLLILFLHAGHNGSDNWYSTPSVAVLN